MKTDLMPSSVQYLIAENGERMGVVLTWKDYQRLQAAFVQDPDLLTDLGEVELQTLAEGMLSPRHQEHLDEWLQRNREHQLSDDEERELDLLLERVEFLNTVKARAMYTLKHRHQMRPGVAG